MNSEQEQLRVDLASELTQRVETAADRVKWLHDDLITDPESAIRKSDIIGDARSLDTTPGATWPSEPLALLELGQSNRSVLLTMTTAARVEAGGGLSYESLSGRVCFTVEVRSGSSVDLQPSDCSDKEGRIPDLITEGEEQIVSLSELEVGSSDPKPFND